jgi:uncharacterized protein
MTPVGSHFGDSRDCASPCAMEHRLFGLGYALAAFVGLSLGLLGGGGSILTVPILVYVVGYDPKLAIAMSLPVVGVTSLVGALSHWRAGNVNLRTAGSFGAVAMLGAFIGAKGAGYLSGTVQLAILGVVMLLAAAQMFRSARRSEPEPATLSTSEHSVGVLAAVALGVGVLTGVVGIGGGFLVVPALVVLARIPMKQAIGTSLIVIAMNAAAGFAGYAGQVQMPWGFLAGFTAVAVAGILLGTYLVRFVSQRALKQGFAVFLLCMGVFVFYKNRGVLLPAPDCGAAPCVPSH